MRLRSFLLFPLLCGYLAGQAQTNDNAYRSASNQYYWKNRMPDKAYWQQDVHYKIHAAMNITDHTIEASEELAYWNNSPDTLRYVYFHLYQNAFIENSYLRDLETANKQRIVLGKYGHEGAGLGIVVSKIQADGQAVKTELDNTIMKVWLPKPLAPGEKVVLKMDFNTYYDEGGTRRRMKMYDAWGFKHYNGVQWFPKICVYDRMHGWDTYQHLNKEFYGDFGLYDVTLDFPSNYVVEATGELQNRSDVLPDELMRKLDIKNFANKKWGEPPSTVIPFEEGKRKQWHYIGNNVHDFAFTADPSYRIGTARWNGVECVAIVQEPHAAKWQNAPDYMTKIIKTFSQQIGMYCYPKIVAADAADGMEYPMITLDGGGEPGYRGLLVHEIGHNWFYGQVGSNETYRAAMDEGFTQFITATGLRAIDGDTLVADPPKSSYRRHFTEPQQVLDRSVMYGYLRDAVGKTDMPINTHSDDFNGALNHGGGYGLVYYKTAAMLYNLQYVLGDDLFWKAMQHYFDQWKFAHPYFEDFRASIIQYTKVDLSWFFDEWFETTKTLDYGIERIRKIRGTDSFAVKFRRLDEMQMPIDFTVRAKDGSTHDFYIPNTWFQKQTTATTLPKWYGWGKLHNTYTAHVYVPSGIKSVQIDTTFRFADRDMRNNYLRRGWNPRRDAVLTRFDGGVAAPADRRKARMYYRPDIWWNAVDGIKVGLHVEGDYMFTIAKQDATIWYNTSLLQERVYKGGDHTPDAYIGSSLNYSYNLQTPISRTLPKLQLQVNSRMLDGLWYHRLGFNWLFGDNTVSLYGQMMWRERPSDLDYLLYPAEWSSAPGRKNNTLNASWTHRYDYKSGTGRYTFALRAPILQKDIFPFTYSYAQLESVNYNYLGRLEVRTRVFGRWGLGRQIPNESALFLAGANPEELMENKYTRSVGFVPNDWQGVSSYDVNHFQQGGGLNLRGYAGYYAPDMRNGSALVAYKGRSGASASAEVGFENYMPWRPKLFRNWLHANVYAFGDVGIMELASLYVPNNIAPTTLVSDVRADAGLGIALTVKNWGVFDKARPLTIRFDVPLFLNRPPYNNAQYTTFRYVVGINRTF